MLKGETHDKNKNANNSGFARACQRWAADFINVQEIRFLAYGAGRTEARSYIEEARCENGSPWAKEAEKMKASKKALKMQQKQQKEYFNKTQKEIESRVKLSTPVFRISIFKLFIKIKSLWQKKKKKN